MTSPLQLGRSTVIRITLLFIGTAGLLFTAWLDDPDNYAHDALFPPPATTIARSPWSTTGTVVVATPAVPQASPTTTTAVAAPARPFTTVPNTSTSTIPASARCAEWWGFAAIYFEPEELEVVDRIMWNESRCQPDAISRTGDYGLMQINWSVWGDTINSQGFYREDLLNPAVNLMWGYLIAHEAERIGWCTWQPWYMSGEYAC